MTKLLPRKIAIKLAYHQPFQITGFHSCDKTVGLDVLNGRISLNHSDNTWDWLGNGIYFWEQNPQRALKYAIESAKGIQKNKIQIKTPFVIGAIIELGNCLNLLEPKSLSLVKEAYDSLIKTIAQSGKKIPENKGPIRRLDCAVIKALHKLIAETGGSPYDTVRSAFHEGEFLYETSNFTSNLHIEICVINPECIKGYFLPMPIDEHNPYLNKEFDKESY